MGAWRNYFTGIVIFIGVIVLFSSMAFQGFNELGMGNITGIPPVWVIIIFFSLLVIILQNPKFVKRLIKKLSLNRKKNSNANPKNLFSWKIFLIYGITFSIGYWISKILLSFVKTDNTLIIFLMTGLILELSAKTCQMFLYNKLRITMDKIFVLWVLIHSVVVYVVLYLIKVITITNKYLFIFAVGFGVALVTHIIWRFIYKSK